MKDDTGAISEALDLVCAFIVGSFFSPTDCQRSAVRIIFKTPIQAFENQASGLIQIGIGSTILLVLIGGIAAVTALPGFIWKPAKEF